MRGLGGGDQARCRATSSQDAGSKVQEKSSSCPRLLALPWPLLLIQLPCRHNSLARASGPVCLAPPWRDTVHLREIRGTGQWAAGSGQGSRIDS